jgi:uncharacterized membrane protein YfcA
MTNSQPTVVALLSVLGLTTAFFAITWTRDLRARRRGASGEDRPRLPSRTELAIGVVTNFFDTLGIGSYAPTTTLFRLRRLVPDPLIPGTLNVGHTPPSVAQAFIFIAIVEVDPTTLVSMIAAAVLGAWLGASVVLRLSKRRIQLSMGGALVAASIFMLLRQLDLLPGAGEATGLPPMLLAIAVVANFMFGALMTVGVGLFAPCMIVVSLLGMNTKAAFPIMMGSCALLMSLAGTRFITHGRYAPRAALGLTLGGVPAVLVAAFVVKALPLGTIRWCVVGIVLYTAVGLLRDALRNA